VHNISLLANHLNKNDFQIFAIALTNAGDKESELELNKDSGVIFRRIDEKKKFDPASIGKIAGLIKEFDVDILSCHGYKADIYGFILRRFYNVRAKIITVAHGWVTPGLKLQFYYLLDKLAIGSFDKVILVSRALTKELKGFMIPKSKIVCIDNAVDIREFARQGDTAETRRALNINDDDFVAMFAGRLSKEKNVITILLAVKELAGMGKKIKLLVAGDGPLRHKLTEAAKKLGIEEYVIFAGYQKDIKKIYSISDVYVSASFKEGISNSLLEAQAMGIPCIASDIGGNNDIVKDGVNGFLFKPEDHRCLAKKLGVLMGDKVLAGKFILEGQRIVRERFSLGERVLKFEEMYRGIISKR